MKKTLLILVLFLCGFCLLLCGCNGQKTTEKKEYLVYFPEESERFGGPALVTERHKLQEGEELIPELLRLLMQGPQAEGRSSLIPSDVTVRDWILEDGVLSVDFTSSYGLLSGIDLTLADYSVTITLSQVAEVNEVVTSVEGDKITYRDYQKLNASDVLLSIYRSEPVLRQVRLFFPTADQKALGQETRVIWLGQDDSLTLTVLMALAKGPDMDSFMGVLTESEIISASVKDGICYLNLVDTFPSFATGESVADRLSIFSIVNTLCELDNITAVRFLAEGKSMERFGAVDLREPMSNQTNLIVMNEKTIEKE